MGNREEFEKWATKTGFDILKDAFGDYVFPGTASAWVTWQARQPEIDAKDKTIGDLALQKGILKAEIGRLTDENTALKAEVGRLRKDAERYRWLRNPAIDPGWVIDKRVRHVGPDGETDSIDWEYRSGEELDAAIDAAMETK